MAGKGGDVAGETMGYDESIEAPSLQGITPPVRVPRVQVVADQLLALSKGCGRPSHSCPLSTSALASALAGEGGGGDSAPAIEEAWSLAFATAQEALQCGGRCPALGLLVEFLDLLRPVYAKERN